VDPERQLDVSLMGVGAFHPCPHFYGIGGRTVTRTVAIVGFYEDTLKLLKHSQADKAWTMNHHVMLDEKKPPEERLLRHPMDAVFELHERDWYLKKETPSYQEYEEWLKLEHPFPIYMQEVDPGIPASVRYPLEAVCSTLLGGFYRGDEPGRFFKSSVDYMLALAALRNYDRVELLGIEAETGTEYEYQREGMSFWIGLLLGRGIEVYLPPTCKLCKAI